MKILQKHGFSLLEVIIVFSIISILATAGVGAYGTMYTNTQVEEATNTVMQALRLAQGRSASGYMDSAYGLKFLSDSYVLYRGASYDLRVSSDDRDYELADSIEINSSVGDDINFSKLLGLPQATTTIEVVHRDGHKKIIMINKYGVIEEAEL